MAAQTSSDRRKAIAWASIELLGRDGARGLTHRAVDQNLGLPPGSTSYYFPTKEQLWNAACEALTEADRLDVEARLSPEGTVDLEGLLAAWSAPGDRIRTVARFEIYLAASRDEGFRAHLRPRRALFLKLVSQTLSRGGSPDPDAEALALVARFEGLLLQRSVFGDAPD